MDTARIPRGAVASELAKEGKKKWLIYALTLILLSASLLNPLFFLFFVAQEKDSTRWVMVIDCSQTHSLFFFFHSYTTYGQLTT